MDNRAEQVTEDPSPQGTLVMKQGRTGHHRSLSHRTQAGPDVRASDPHGGIGSQMRGEAVAKSIRLWLTPQTHSVFSVSAEATQSPW